MAETSLCDKEACGLAGLTPFRISFPILPFTGDVIFRKLLEIFRAGFVYEMKMQTTPLQELCVRA